MNLTANGTSSGGFYNGKKAYIHTAGYDGRLTVEAEIPGGGAGMPPAMAPTIAWIQQQVAQGQDVEVEIGWINQSGEWDNGHFVAITGYNAANLLTADPEIPGTNASPLPYDGTHAYTFSFDNFGNATAPYTYNYPVVTYYDPYYANDTEIIYSAFAESPEPTAADPFRHRRHQLARLRLASATDGVGQPS